MMNTRKTSAKEIQRSGVLGSEVQGFSPSAGGEAASLIEKETNEHRTSNIERPTSNNVFCQFKKKTEQSESTLRNSTRLLSTGSSPELAEGSRSTLSLSTLSSRPKGSQPKGSSQAAVRLF